MLKAGAGCVFVIDTRPRSIWPDGSHQLKDSSFIDGTGDKVAYYPLFDDLHIGCLGGAGAEECQCEKGSY